MQIIILILSLFIATSSFAEVKLFRYTDKLTGNEMGVAYSDKDGNPQVNPDWNIEEIQEKDKDKYIKEQEKQSKQKQDAQEAAKLIKKNKAVVRLKANNFTDDEIEAIVK